MVVYGKVYRETEWEEVRKAIGGTSTDGITVDMLNNGGKAGVEWMSYSMQLELEAGICV